MDGGGAGPSHVTPSRSLRKRRTDKGHERQLNVDRTHTPYLHLNPQNRVLVRAAGGPKHVPLRLARLPRRGELSAELAEFHLPTPFIIPFIVTIPVAGVEPSSSPSVPSPTGAGRAATGGGDWDDHPVEATVCGGQGQYAAWSVFFLEGGGGGHAARATRESAPGRKAGEEAGGEEFGSMKKAS